MTGYDVFAIVVILFSVAAGWVRGGDGKQDHHDGEDLSLIHI